MKKLWFKRKKYGWGWTPSTWQGWLLVLGYIVCILVLSLGITRDIQDSNPLANFFAPVAFLTLLLLYITYKTGEKPRWQWGEKD